MAENPLVHVPAAWPVLMRANQLRRRVVGRVRSIDMLQWDGVTYGDDLAQRMHIWELNDLCPRDGWPAVLLLHGGGWVEGGWQDFESLAPLMSRKGLFVAAVDYRLAPDHRWPTQLEDVLGALAFVRSQQVDLSRVAIWGHSAGAQLAMLAALARPDWVRCVVGTGTPADLRTLAMDGPDDLGLVFSESQLKSASPVLMDCEQPPPIRLVHGERDPVVDVAHAKMLQARWPDQVVLDIVPDGDHGLRWPPFASYQARRRAVQWMVDELDLPSRGSKWKRKKEKK